MKIHQCPICRKTFSKDSIIRIHLEQDHQIFDRKNLETITSEEYNIMRCHREIKKQNSQDGIYISGVFEYTYQDSGEPSENAQQINEESTQNSEENEETSQDEQHVHEESTQNSEESAQNSEDEQQVHEENIEDSDEIPDFEENDLISCPFCNDDFTATNELTYHLAISHDAKLNMKTTVPLKNKRKSPVHVFDEISTPDENNQNSEENEENSQDEQQVHEESSQNSEENEEMDEDDDEIPDFENEPKGTNLIFIYH